MAELRAEMSQQRSKTLEEQKKRETQDSLVRRLQKRVLLLTKVPGQSMTHKNKSINTDTLATIQPLMTQRFQYHKCHNLTLNNKVGT